MKLKVGDWVYISKRYEGNEPSRYIGQRGQVRSIESNPSYPYPIQVYMPELNMSRMYTAHEIEDAFVAAVREARRELSK